MKKQLMGTLLAATTLLGMSSSALAKTNINMSLVFTQNELLTQELIKVTDKIRARTGGEVNIRVFPGGQLPVYKDNLEQVVNGANWIAVEDLSYLGDYVPDFAALAGPMLYKSYDEYLALMQTDYVAELTKKAHEKGIKVLSADYIFGFRHMITNKEIKTSEDMKGMRIRVPGSQLFISTLKAMGAAPAALPFPETYAGVQQGVVDGLEGSILTMYSTKIYEVAKNMSKTGHFLGTVGLYISPKVWNKISADDQKIVMEEILAGAKSNTANLIKLDEEYTQKLMEKGVTFNEVDKAEFNKLTSEVYNQFPSWSPNVHATINAELTKIRKAM